MGETRNCQEHSTSTYLPFPATLYTTNHETEKGLICSIIAVIIWKFLAKNHKEFRQNSLCPGS